MMFFLAEAPAAPAAPPASPALVIFMQLLPFILMGVIIWFLLIRPERQKQKRHRGMLSQLAKNDNVVTTAGSSASSSRLADAEVTLLVDEKHDVTIRILRSASTTRSPTTSLRASWAPELKRDAHRMECVRTMYSSLRWRIPVILALTVASALVVFWGQTPWASKDYGLKLGFDLKGGVELVYRIEGALTAEAATDDAGADRGVQEGHRVADEADHRDRVAGASTRRG